MKTIKKQVKKMMLIFALVLSTHSYAQKEIIKGGMFVRVYNLDGKKLNKGHVAFVSDTILGLKRNGNYVEINVREIGAIETKRAAGHNLLIGAAAGAATGALLGAATADPDAWVMGYTVAEGLAGGAILGAAAGAAVGGITVLTKDVNTYMINGDLGKWLIFKESIENHF